MAIKNWELGRIIPKSDGIENLIEAFAKYGVYVSFDWILFGNGPGPSYIKPIKSPEEIFQDDMLKQLELFKISQRALNLNPIIVEVADSLMEPIYSEKDVLGG